MQAQHDLVLSEARRRGYAVDVVDALDASVVIEGEVHRIKNGTPRTLIDFRAEACFDHKQKSKSALDELGIRTPKSILFEDPGGTQVLNFIKPGKKYVCKPPDGTEGEGVQLNISSAEEVVRYARHNAHLGPEFMLEQQIDLADLRVQVVGGAIVAACVREPAYVVGDGANSITTLVAKRREIVRKQKPVQ